MPMNGKAVNAIRSFTGEGIKVWGARTLDGNSQDWRYVNVRRTMIFLEVSFEERSQGIRVRAECGIHLDEHEVDDGQLPLRSIWKRGGLAGSTPEEAYEIHGDWATQ